MVSIRPESPGEYTAVAEIHALAFDEQLDASEVVLVDVHRRHPGFDPELSLVAEWGGRPVGHILLIPRLLRVKGVTLRGTILSPLGVLPELQRRGIGGALVREAHDRARRRGYQLVVLTGHPGYYPHFGYRTAMFSWSGIAIRRGHIPREHPVIDERRVTPGDIPHLMDMWHLWFDDVDLAVVPGGSVLDWISPSRQVTSCAAWIEDRLVGYVRYDSERIRGFLAEGPEAAVCLLSHLARRVSGGGDHLEVPVHPESRACTGLAIPFESRLETPDAAMICILDRRERALVQYCAELEEGSRSPGLVVWPVEYDVC